MTLFRHISADGRQKHLAGLLLGLSQIALAGADANGVPINHKGSLPPLTTLTLIHPHLAVQYRMCIVRQLPHVPLLTASLRQGTPTSLSKCVFEGADVRCVLHQGRLCGQSCRSLNAYQWQLLLYCFPSSYSNTE